MLFTMMAAKLSVIKKQLDCNDKWHYWPHPDVKDCPACGSNVIKLRVKKDGVG